jgi:hypothetical protein
MAASARARVSSSTYGSEAVSSPLEPRKLNPRLSVHLELRTSTKVLKVFMLDPSGVPVSTFNSSPSSAMALKIFTVCTAMLPGRVSLWQRAFLWRLCGAVCHWIKRALQLDVVSKSSSRSFIETAPSSDTAFSRRYRPQGWQADTAEIGRSSSMLPAAPPVAAVPFGLHVRRLGLWSPAASAPCVC